jgi:hypothetical protein
MSPLYTHNHLYFLKSLIVLDGFTKNLVIIIRDLHIPKKRRFGFKKRLPTP